MSFPYSSPYSSPYSLPSSSPISSPSLRKSYTAKFKSDVLKHFDPYGNSPTALAFGISPSMITKWNKMRVSLLRVNSDTRRIGSGRIA